MIRGSDFLRVARDLFASSREEDRRTSIGRSYYALFNDVRERVKGVKQLPGRDEDHQALVEYLTGCNNKALYSVGQHLKDLRKSRNVADYEMAATVDGNQSGSALHKAESGVQTFSAVAEVQLKASLAARPVFKSRRPS
jgi:hypothetical protein